MAAPIDRSPLKAAPLQDPGQSLRGMSIDLVLGRLLPWVWIASIGWALALQAWMSQRFGWHLSFPSLALVALGLSAVCALQFYSVAGRVKDLQLGRDGERLVGEFLEQQLIPRAPASSMTCPQTALTSITCSSPPRASSSSRPRP